MHLLIISEAAPGEARSANARLMGLLKAFPALGVTCDILTVKSQEKMSVGMPPPDGRVVKVVVPLTGRIRKTNSVLLTDGGYARACIRHPGLRTAAAAGVRLVDERRPDAIVATVPHAMMLEIGYQVSIATGVPLVADWRDPVALRPFSGWPNRRYYLKLKHREETWARHAILNIATAPSYERILAREYRCRTCLVSNGCEPAEPAREIDAGTVLYTGNLTAVSRGFARRFPPIIHERVLNCMTMGLLFHAPFAERIRYHAFGRSALAAMSAHASRIGRLAFQGGKLENISDCLKPGLCNVLSHAPWVTPDEAQRAMTRAQLLWLCLAGTDDRHGEPVIASKVFGYLASGRPIFAVLPPECDTSEVLRGQPGVFLADPNDPGALEDSFRQALDLPPAKRFERDVSGLRRDVLAGRFVEAIRAAITGSRANAAGPGAPTPARDATP